MVIVVYVEIKLVGIRKLCSASMSLTTGPLIEWARWARAQGPAAQGPELRVNFLLRHHNS